MKKLQDVAKAGKELGMYVVQEIDIGVSACGYYSGTVVEDISVSDFEDSLIAAAKMPQSEIEAMLFAHAGKVESLDCISITKYTSIFDLLEGQLKKKVWEATNWHDSWLGFRPEFDRSEYWKNISPIDYSGFTVWYEKGFHKVYCEVFEKFSDALQFFNQTHHACILCQWNEGGKGEAGTMEELKSYWGWSHGARETCKKTS